MSDLSKIETDQLMEMYKDTGNVAIRNVIVERNLGLAAKIASKFIGRGVDYEDLFQVASLALIGAIDRFDVTKGYRFSTFASPTIIGEIKNYFRDKTRLLHITRNDSEQLMKYNEVRDRLEKQGIFSIDSIAKEMGVPEERVMELTEMQSSLGVSSLDRLISDDSDNALKDLIGEEDFSFERIELREDLDRIVSVLDEKEKIIFGCRFMDKISQKDVAKRIGTSQMYVSRAERRIIRKIKELFGDELNG